MRQTKECRCGRAMNDDRESCQECQASLETALLDCAWLDDELETSITRQRSSAIEGGSPSAERGLPWHDKASEARRNLHGLLVSWVRFCDEEAIAGRPNTEPRDTVPSLARWLLHCTHGLAMRDIGPEAVDEITNAVAECQRIIFWKRRNRTYLGTCEQRVEDEDGTTLLERCPGEVYANEGEPVGICDECGQGVTVVIRQSEIDERLAGHLCTAAEVARLAVFLGLKQPRDKVRKRVLYWHRHKRITQKATAANGDPMFEYGDVRALLFAEFGRESA